MWCDKKSLIFFKQILDLEIDPSQTFPQVLNKTIIGGFCQKNAASDGTADQYNWRCLDIHLNSTDEKDSKSET